MIPRDVGSNGLQDEGIDFVIIWVDGADHEWQAEKLKYSGGDASNSDVDASIHRYRDWNNLQYLFRSIEQYAPWVRKVHFVTAGHIPAWLNLDAEKLNFVKHEDYIPAEYLPTFSANPIELNLHRIEGLSEKFVYLNDDLFLTRPMKESDFFVDGLPCDMLTLNRVSSSNYNDIFPHILINNMSILNKYFNRNSLIKSHFSKLFNLRYGLQPLIRNLAMIIYPSFSNLSFYHVASPFLKSTFNELWDREYDVLDGVSRNKFRNIKDVNQYLMKNWQMLSGGFHPTNIKKASRVFSKFPEEQSDLISAIENHQYSMICINDTDECENFEQTRDGVANAFEKLLPNKSSFER